MKIALALLPLVIGLALAPLAFATFEAPQASVLGVNLPRIGDRDAALRETADAWLDTPITIDAGSDVRSMTRRALGAHLDLAMADLDLGGDLRIGRRVDEGAVYSVLELIRESTDRAPKIAGDESQPAENGARLDLMGSLRVIESAMRDGELYVRLPVDVLAPPERPELSMLDLATFTEELSAFETRYSARGESAGRAHNIEISAAELDGFVLAPGEVLSFNASVGERSPERGYQEAKEWRNGELVDGIGGGVCQTAATLFAAAYLAGFDVLEQHPHTRQARYAPDGLDTSVAWPSSDLRVRNPYPFPIMVRSSALRGVVRVSLLGTGKLHEVEWSAVEVVSVPNEDGTIDAAAVEAGFEGSTAGRILLRTRTIHRDDGPITEETYVRYEEAS